MNKVKSYLFVFFQFFFLFLLLFFTYKSFFNPLVIALTLLSLIPALWGFTALKLNNFSVQPIPKKGAVHRKEGPYHYIRHPMYLTIILFSLVQTLFSLSWYSFVSFALIFITIYSKAKYEESLLIKSYPTYADYIKHTKMFFPGIF
jgi:protein-S-isoprenylcysteine O-methyltransferase Ste14